MSSLSKDGKQGVTAAIVSLGCAKNQVDSEHLAARLREAGYDLTSEAEQAALIVVNTCGFLQSAVEESIQVILELSQFKETGTCRKLVVAGCMVQRYGNKLPELLPEVDFFIGTSHFGDLVPILAGEAEPDSATEPPGAVHIGPARHTSDCHTPRLRSTPFHTAYLKIAEGCGNRCAYCMIPALRGPLRSRPVDDVLAEARAMAAEGVVEISLIAQDTTAYGLDRKDPEALVRLLRGLETIDGLQWVRLLYAHPSRISGALLETMAESAKIVPYLDIPIQHSVPRLLQAMNRGLPDDVPDLKTVLSRIRKPIPQIALRTSVMVGFPGETDDDFQDLLDFLDEARFDHLGAFAFSPEPGTRAAGMKGQIPEELREERKNRVMELQRAISHEKLEAWIGRTVPVLVEGEHPETELLLAGRTAAQAPEVDGLVMITSGEAEQGRIVPARITAAHDYDLEAELTGD